MKDKNLSSSVIRQLEVLENYYKINKEKKIITISLHYDDINEIVDNDYVGNKLPSFKDEFLRKISEIIDSFPYGYKVDIDLDIDNLRGYKLKEVMKALEDALEIFHYTTRRFKNKNFLFAMILMGVGVISLFLMVLFNNHVELPDQGFQDMISEIIDIIAWVFIWEAVTLIALEPSQYNAISFKLITRLNIITLHSKKNKISVNAHDLITNFVQFSAKEKVSDTMILISGVGLLSITLPSFIRYIIYLVKDPSAFGSGTYLTLNIIFLSIYTLVSIFFGVLSIFYYVSQKNKYLNALNILIPLVSVISIAFLGAVSYSIIIGSFVYVEIIPFVFATALSILAFIGWIFKLIRNKNTK